MARPPRIELPGAHYRVASRGNARRNVFLSDAYHICFPGEDIEISKSDPIFQGVPLGSPPDYLLSPHSGLCVFDAGATKGKSEDNIKVSAYGAAPQALSREPFRLGKRGELHQDTPPHRYPKG